MKSLYKNEHCRKLKIQQGLITGKDPWALCLHSLFFMVSCVINHVFRYLFQGCWRTSLVRSFLFHYRTAKLSWKKLWKQYLWNFRYNHVHIQTPNIISCTLIPLDPKLLLRPFVLTLHQWIFSEPRLPYIGSTWQAEII